MLFSELQLHPALGEAVRAAGYTTPTPIQAQTIPHGLAGKDVLGCAQTGTGKTAAFALPILHRLMDMPKSRTPRALVLVPTRELCAQVSESFNTYGKRSGLRATAIYGGVGQGNQVRALQAGVDVLVAAPGRLLDLMEQGYVSLRTISVLVLDEADRMLDMGFIQPIRRIVGELPRERQNLMFSATMAPEIRTLAGQILRNPVQVSVAPVATTADRVEQGVFFVDHTMKFSLLMHVLEQPQTHRVIVFTRTKHGADRVERRLNKERVEAAAIHGNKSQNQRQRALAGFKDGKVRVLVATDVAARGIDVDDVSHVVNYDVPHEPDSYVHRIGRTGRAGGAGIAWSFCDREERGLLRDIERLIKKPVPVMAEHPFVGMRAERSAESARDERPREGAAREGAPRQGSGRPQGRNNGGARQGQRNQRRGYAR